MVAFLLAPSLAAAAECPNEALRVGPSANLPDCRAYEQATPIDKNGFNANGAANLVQAANNGNRTTFFDEGGLPGAEGSQDFQIYLAQRGAVNWSARGLLPPAPLGYGGRVLGWSEDEAYSFVAATPSGIGSENPTTLYMRDNETGELTEISGEVTRTAGLALDGASEGTRLVAFESKTKLPGTNAIDNKSNVYLWNRESGEVILGSVLNNGLPPTSEGSFAGPYRWWPTTETKSGGAAEEFYAQAEHVLSADGSRLFFTAGQKAPGTGVQIYMRENPSKPQSALAGGECSDADLACTHEVSQSERSTPDPNGPKPAALIGATPDGSVAFFMSSSALTDSATTGPTDEGNDLYRYEADAPLSGRLTDLTPDPFDANGIEVKGVLGYSDDGTYVYYAAANALPGTGAPPSTCSGTGQNVTGACNIYLWHDDPISHHEETIFVTQLNAEGDNFDWSPRAKGNGNNLTVPTARVADDGTLLFASIRSLTGYDSVGPTCGVGAEFGDPGPCSELFRYVPGSAPTLDCISCSPAGGPAIDHATLASISALSVPVTKPSFVTRNLSGDGSRIFFESPSKLVPADINGEGECPDVPVPGGGSDRVPRCQDVYEWEAKGSGSCESDAANGGCLYLLSTGTSPAPSYFADSDTAGDNAFFFTFDQLVGQDRDQLLDVYDARVGGGLVAQNPPLPMHCEGEACRGSATPPPGGGTPGSATFVGPGNEKPKVHKKRHHKRHHHKKHHRHHKKMQKKHKRPHARKAVSN